MSTTLTASMPDRAEAWRRMAITSATFVAGYGACNALTALRMDVGATVFAWERAIPFVPWSIVPYLSIVAFFAHSFFADRDPVRQRTHTLALLLTLAVSLACYALVPQRFVFERPPTEGIPAALYALLGTLDAPYNRAPSLHIGVLVVLWACYAPRLSGPQRAALATWFALVAVSVLTTYQHHVIDLPAGAAVGACAVAIARRAVARRAPG